jgi:Tol biopolymer transport system component
MGALVAELEKAAARRARLVVAGAVAGTAALMAAAVAFSRPPPPFRPEVVPVLPIHDEEISFPAWSPDGRFIAWGSNHDGRDRLWIAPADGSGAPRAITPPEVTAVFPRWTHDGSAILLLDDHERLFRVPLDGGAPRLIMQGPRAFADCAGRLVVSLRGAPGCTDCAVLAERGASADRVLVLLPSRAQINDLRCDTAGKALVYSQSGPDRHWRDSAAIWTLPLEGGEPRRITDGNDFDFNPTFHPDGRSVVFARWRKGSARLWEVPARGGEAVQLTSAEGEDEDKGPDVSPDGRTLLYVHETRTIELLAYSLRNGTRLQLSRELESVGTVAVTPDGAEVIGEASAQWAPTRRKRIKAWPLRGGEVRDLGEGYHPGVTHDGSQVIFARALLDGGTRLVAVPRAGGPERTVAELPDDVRQVVVGPDEVVHVSVSGTSGRMLFRVPVAGGIPQAQPGPTIGFYPSPAGGWAVSVVQRADGRLEGQLIEDGARSQIASFVMKRGAWSGGGEAFVYSNGSDVRRYTIATREDKVILPAAVADGVAVSPDGDTIYVSESHARCIRRLITNFADRPRPR